jgi:glutamate 5-kinase
MAKTYRRIVAKLGTGLLTSGTDQLDTTMIAALAAQVAKLRSAGSDVIVVTSGAIAAGRERLKIGHAGGKSLGRKDMPFRQVLASVGQSHLMQTYDSIFRTHDIVVAQTLLTRRDLSDRVAYLNARNTLLALLDLGALPIVNENDVVAVEEIADAHIGDNDNLSALVANLVDADLLAILTDIGGLYTADPRVDDKAELIPRVERVTPEVEQLAGEAGSARGVGGMITKLQAAKLAAAGGTDVVIADGRERDVLERLAAGEAIGTLFTATGDRMESRKRWMLSGLAARGKIVVDAGAARALRSGGKSLLPAGVQDIEGPFERGDTVPIFDHDGHRIAVGITNYGHEDASAIRGIHSDKIAETLGHEFGAELVHRNNLVVL